MDPLDVSDFSLFNPSIIAQPDVESFFVSVHQLNGYYGYDANTELDNINLQEWKSFLNLATEDDTLRWLVYKSSISDLQHLLNSFQGIQIPDSVYIPSAFQSLTNKKIWSPALKYLIFAKKIESLLYYNYWEQIPEADSIKPLLEEALQLFKKQKKGFLKGRYAFQRLKLLYSQRQFQEGIAFYENLKKDLPQGSAGYRCTGYYGGCKYGLQQFAEANLIFARLYEYLPMRISAYVSFHPWEDSDWNKSLELANDHEKVLLWHLYSIYADPLKGIEEMLKIDPSTTYALLPLVRIVNIVEENRLTRPDLDYYEYYDSPGEEGAAIETFGDSYASWVKVQNNPQEEILSKLTELSGKPDIYRRDVWISALAYLHWLNGNNRTSEELLQRSSSGSEEVKKQNTITRMLNYLSGIHTSDAAVEQKLYTFIEEITADRSGEQHIENAIRHALNLHSKHYPDDSVKVLLCNSDPSITTAIMANSMLSFLQRENHTPFEKFIINRYPLTGDDLLNAFATVQVTEQEWQAAIDLYKQMKNIPVLPANPFNIRITDCHDCDHALSQNRDYSYLWFAEQMRDIRTNAGTAKDPTERSRNYFLYANGLYNLTWFGNCRSLLEYAPNWAYTGNNFYRYKFNDRPAEVPTPPLFNCKPALENYSMAFRLSTDSEFKAKMVWMSAKCEHNIWLESQDTSKADFIAGVSFQKMKNEFAGTTYYKEVLTECGYFCTYITRKPECIRNTDNY